RSVRGGVEDHQLQQLVSMLDSVILSSSNASWICESHVEDSSHLFFNCSLAKDVMSLVCRWWDVGVPNFTSYAEWLVWFNTIRLGSKLKIILEGIFYVTWWSL
ncbi:hypothetical protein Tco_1367792, partial [Tanacetum coccineum]